MKARYLNTGRKTVPLARAAALSYDPVGSAPPEIVALGRGLRAEEIVRIAREHDVPIHQDAGLVEALAKLEVGETIPRELYAVVAEVLAFVYALDAQAAQ
jgi:flagellar biosynthesis protein